MGKHKVVKLMSLNISQMFEVKKKHPVILKWRPTHSDPSPPNSTLKNSNEDRVITDNIGSSEVQTDPNSQGIRISSRPKKMIFYGSKV
jgi:hypothetical protein